MLDFIGHIGYAFIFMGLILLTYKNKWGWICRLIGGALWIGIGLALNLTSIWIWGIIFVCLDARGWWKWKKHERRL